MRRVVLSLAMLGCAAAQPVAAPAATTNPVAVAEDEPLAEEEPERVAIPAVGPWIGGAPSSDYVLAGMRDEFIGVWVDVPEGAVAEHVPTALSLVIDTSGSMKGDKIVHARRAALKLIDELEDGDVVSIVTFADDAKVRLSPTVLDHRSRRRARAVVKELHAIGGTALMDGLQQAEGQFWSVTDAHLVRRVVMISDGQATIGTSDPHALGTVAEAGMDRGVQVTSIGVGLDYDEETLNALAIRSSGRLYHLTESEELASLVEREVSLLQATAAASAIVEILPAPGVTLRGVEMARFARVRDRIHVPLGSMHGGQQRELLLRVRVDAQAMGRKPLASVRFHFKDPTEGGLQRVHESVVAAQITDSPSLVAEHAVPRTATMVAMRSASDLAREASASANAGNLDLAISRLDEAERQLRNNAHRAKDKREKKRLNKQADNMGRLKRDVDRASKSSGAKRKKKSRAAALELNAEAMAVDGY